jgi:hypothetical protein
MTTDDRWKTYFLYGYGFKSDANCAALPGNGAPVRSRSPA